jgi:hypothetical protein
MIEKWHFLLPSGLGSGTGFSVPIVLQLCKIIFEMKKVQTMEA